MEDQETPDISEATEGEQTSEPSKGKIKFEAALSRDEAVSYFEAIVTGLRNGSVEFRQDEESLVLQPGQQLEVSVMAARKGDKNRITFEIGWRGVVAEPKLSILS